jgi:dTDP-4-dehydrorhamnose 3,5-epimerase
MSIKQIGIAGVTLTELKEIKDHRGAVLHMLRADAPDFTRFGECYFSEVLPGAVKAWKKHTLQTQNLSVPVGRIRLVIFDGRNGVPSKDAVEIIELGRPDAYVRIRVPPGLWYGFTCISEVPALLVNCADIPYENAESEVKEISDPSIPYTWDAS